MKDVHSPWLMEKIIVQGQLLFGIAIAAFGIENLICGHFGLTVRGVPWFSANGLVAYPTGIVLLVAGLSIVANVRARMTATLLGILFLLYLPFFEVSALAAKPMSTSVRTVFFETLAMASSALTLAETLPTAPTRSRRWDSVLTGAAFILAGISILTKWMDQWGAFMLGTMFVIWFFILHSPRVVVALRSHNPNSQNECSSALIALGMCGGCWICALHAH